MNCKDKKIMIAGLGKSGMAAWELLKEMGAEVCLFDGNSSLDISEYDVPVYLSDVPDEVLDALDFAVFSPGVPLSVPIAEKLKKKQIPVIGEIELAWMAEKGTVAGITGTNGKTTTTTLVGEIMKAAGGPVYVVGNIGNPYTKEVMKTTADSVTVAEISSFQLETVDTFRPRVSAILNITPDHLNRHGTMENYTDAKFRITENQTADDVCVLNFEDSRLRERAEKLSCRTVFFSSRQPLKNGLFQNEKGDIVDGRDGKILMNMRESNIPGDHNCENIMAAILMTRELGVPDNIIIQAVKSFHAVEHRVEYVCEKNGVVYYNDSKGTNPDAAIKGIHSMDRKTVLIGGGYDKGGGFEEWIGAFDGKVTKLLLLGETGKRIAETAEKMGFFAYEFTDTLEQAVKRAAEIAKPGEAVLLSPACASWDMFDSYEQRGNLFKEYVLKL